MFTVIEIDSTMARYLGNTLHRPAWVVLDEDGQLVSGAYYKLRNALVIAAMRQCAKAAR